MIYCYYFTHAISLVETEIRTKDWASKFNHSTEFDITCIRIQEVPWEFFVYYFFHVQTNENKNTNENNSRLQNHWKLFERVSEKVICVNLDAVDEVHRKVNRFRVIMYKNLSVFPERYRCIASYRSVKQPQETLLLRAYLIHFAYAHCACIHEMNQQIRAIQMEKWRGTEWRCNKNEQYRERERARER